MYKINYEGQKGMLWLDPTERDMKHLPNMADTIKHICKLDFIWIGTGSFRHLRCYEV